MRRLARLTGTVPCPTADLLSRHLPLGRCKRFFVESAQRTGKELIARVDKSYSFFEGCIESLGCTLCISGKDLETLRKVKSILRQMLFFGRDIVLETAFLHGSHANFGAGQVYLADAIGADRYISARSIEITKLYLHQGGELQKGPGRNEDDINSKGRRLCGAPKRLKLECYGNNDYPFGVFVSSLMNIINEQCPLCQRKRFTHQLIYCHRDVKIKVSAEPNITERVEEGAGFGGDKYFIVGECKKCGKVVAPPQKMQELYEYSLARFLIGCFYNDKMLNKGDGCSHNAIFDISRRIYQRDAVIRIECELGKVYNYVHSVKIFKPLDKAFSESSPAQDPDKRLLGECTKHLISQYEKLKVMIYNFTTVTKRVSLKQHIKGYVEWLKTFQDEVLQQFNSLFFEEEKKGADTPSIELDRKRILVYARRHKAILQQLHMLLRSIIKVCEPAKDAEETDKQRHKNFADEANASTGDEAWMAGLLQALIPLPLVRGRSTGSVGNPSEVNFGEVDYGGVIATTLQTREYKDTISAILNANRSEDRAEALESELLSGNNYCIKIETFEKGKRPGVTVYRNYEKCDLTLDSPERSAENTLQKYGDEEAVLEKKLTDIASFRRQIEKAAAMAEPEAANVGLVVDEEVVSEVSTVMKQLRQEHTYNENSEVASVYVYCANQFGALRSCLGVDESDYTSSISRGVPWKDVSGGKSKASFYRTRDNKYILKCIKKKEKDLFERNAHQYFKHMCKAIAHDMPSVIVKTLGLYKVKYGKTEACEVLVMENLYYGISPTVVYDLKGSTMRRYVKKEDRIGFTVLLDTNFKEDHNGEPLILDEQSNRYLHDSIHNDSLLLSKLNVMDYSLLAIIDENRSTLKAGIIDIFREFNSAELLEYHTKRAISLGKKPTVIEPNSYKQRFRAAMKKYFAGMPTLFH